MGGHVFLSHNSRDKRAVERLAHALADRGVRPWLDKWDLVPGTPWQDGIEHAIQEAVAVIVCVGRHELGGVQHPETRVALNRAWQDPKFLVIPVYLPDAKDQDLPEFLKERTWIDLREDFESGVRGIERALKGLAPSRPLPHDGVCPYPGLDFFDEKDAGRYFGRDEDTEKLLNRLRGHPDLRMITLVGASGAGKSSLLRAGLAPAVRTGQLDGDHKWYILILRPGSRPLHELAVNLTNRFKSGTRSDLKKLEADLLGDKKTLSEEADLFLNRIESGSRLLLAVDQLEELFTLAENSQEDSAKEISPFLANLLYAAKVADGRVTVLMALRADYLGKLLNQDPDLAEAVKDSQELLLPMKEEQLRTAIVGPAVQARVELQDGLAETLASEVVHQPGDLPLLQFALESLWEKRDGKWLTWRAYRELGGLRDAIVNRAEAHLDENELELLRRRLAEFVQVGESQLDTLRRARLSSLGPEAQELVRKLVEERLMVVRGNEDERTAEFAHESLIRYWPKLRQWLKEDRDFLTWQSSLSMAADRWCRNKRRWSLLYRGFSLRQARAKWQSVDRDRLSPREQEFLKASHHVSILRWAIAAIFGLAFASSGVLAWVQHKRTLRHQHSVKARQLALLAEESLNGGSLLHAVLLAAEGVRSSEAARPFRVPEAEAALRNALHDLGGIPLPLPLAERVYAAAVLEDRVWVASKRSADQLRLTAWDWQRSVVTPEPPKPREAEKILHISPESDGHDWRVEFSPDGRWLAVVDGKEKDHLYDLLAESDEPLPLPYPATAQPTIDAIHEPWNDARWHTSRQGRWQWASYYDHFTLKSLVDDRQLDLLGHDYERNHRAKGVAFGPNEEWAITWSMGEARIWRLTATHPSIGHEPVLFASEDQLPGITCHPAGTWIVKTGDKQRLRVGPDEDNLQECDSEGPKHSGDVDVVAWSPGNEWLFTAGRSDDGRLWRIDPVGSCSFISFGVGLTSSAVIGGDRWIAIGAKNGRVFLADLKRGNLRATAQSLLPSLGRQPVKVIALSDDARWLFAATDQGETRLWELEGGRSIYSVAFPGVESIYAASFSPDGRHLATCHDDGVRLWTLLRNKSSAKKLLEIACKAAGRNLTCAEWREAFGLDEPYRKTCPDLYGPAEPCDARPPAPDDFVQSSSASAAQ